MNAPRTPRRHALRVSDHAVLRFLGRSSGLDVEALRRAMAASLARATAAAELIGGGEYLIVADGLTYVVRDRVVVTVLDRGHASTSFAPRALSSDES
jgi:hypothetical protein